MSFHGEEMPAATDYWDANWLKTTISVGVGAKMGGSFTAEVENHSSAYSTTVDMNVAFLDGDYDLVAELTEELGEYSERLRPLNDKFEDEVFTCHLLAE